MMAKPAFIYAFDNLGPNRFAELCGVLIGSRYKGFVLGGVGPDGGIDAESDLLLGEWDLEEVEALGDDVYQPGQKVIFQFKHKTAARTGQVQARSELLGLYKCTTNKQGEVTRRCELHSTLVQAKRPSIYILVTNVEVNANFRATFETRCREENPDIKHCQIIGLDELESWLTMEPELGQLYFPTIFGGPQFHLRIRIDRMYTWIDAALQGRLYVPSEEIDLREIVAVSNQVMEYYRVSVANVGTATSYIDHIGIRLIVDGQSKRGRLINNPRDTLLGPLSSSVETPLEPGRKHQYNFYLDGVVNRIVKGTESAVFPAEIEVEDEIGNVYSSPIPGDVRERMVTPRDYSDILRWASRDV